MSTQQQAGLKKAQAVIDQIKCEYVRLQVRFFRSLIQLIKGSPFDTVANIRKLLETFFLG